MKGNKLIKPLLLIGMIIIFSAAFVRIFSNSETLAEYAAQNPADTKTEHTQKTEDPADTKTGTARKDEPQKADTDITGSEKIPLQTDTQKGSAALQEMEFSENHLAEPENTENKKEDDMAEHPDRVVYKDGFYYEPLSEEMIKRITGISYPVTDSEKDTTAVAAVNIVGSAAEIQVSYEELCYMRVLHYNFHGAERTGELICNRAIAQDLVEIFYELYQNEYQIEQIRLIDEYSGDDTLSMLDNNTSCFNYRVVDGTSSLSKHALGLAIDINPFFNPYVVFQSDGTTYISPKGSETYADRSQNFAYKIDENDLCYKLFKEHGFIWGGNWNSCKDYQHFQKVPD